MQPLPLNLAVRVSGMLYLRLRLCASWSVFPGNPEKAAAYYADNNATGAVRLLQRIGSGHCGFSKHGRNQRFNAHLESQAMVLSTPLPNSRRGDELGRRRMVPLDYIGRTQHLGEDLLEMLELAARATKRQLSPEQLLAVRSVLQSRNSTHKNTRDEKPRSLDMSKRLRAPWLDSLASKTFAQDVQCFRYT